MSTEPATDPIVNSDQKTTMDDLTAGESMPEVKQNAIDAVEASKASSPLPPPQGQKLKRDGTPAAKRGPKPKDSAGQGQPRTASFVHGAKTPEQAVLIQDVSSEHAATVISGILERAQIMLISDEFTYSTAERLANILAWKNTFDYYGGLQLSPPAALMLDQLGIILMRLPQPKTKEKIANYILKIKGKAVANKFWKFGKKDKEDARANSGPDFERKDNIREEKGGIFKK